MPSRPFVRWYPADYLADTLDFTIEEDLIYRRMLDVMWINQGLSVDKKEIAKSIRISSRKFTRVYDKKLSTLFIEIDEKLWSPRLYKEFLSALEHSETASFAARERWRRERENKSKNVD